MLILSYLEKNTYEKRGVDTAELLAYLQENGIHTDRRTVYKAINTLQSLGYRIIKIHKNYKYTYAIKQDFSVGEMYILTEAIHQNPILTNTEKQNFIRKLSSFLPTGQKELLPRMNDVALLSANEKVLDNIEILLESIYANKIVRFQYYDFTPKREKKYRKDGKPYLVQPVALRCENGRYYGIFLSKKHQSYTTYRVDKIENIKIVKDGEAIEFDEQKYAKSNFNMYSGDVKTITLQANNDMASIVYDTFGDNLLITRLDKDTFTFVIHRPIVPTFLSWLFQFNPMIKVISPSDLIQTLQTKATMLLESLKNTNGQD